MGTCRSSTWSSRLRRRPSLMRSTPPSRRPEGEMAGILAIEETPLVSIDYRCSDVSTTIDAALTMVMGDDMVKVVSWYDNEWGYSQRVVDLAEVVAKGMN